MGAFSGLVGSFALIHIVANTPLSVLCGVMAGTCYSLCFFNRSESLAESVITGSALAMPLWMLLSIIVSPGLAGQTPQWTPHGMQEKLPELVGWMFYGAGLGATIQLLNHVSPWRIGTEPPSTPPVVDVVKAHIVIVGGGFAGMHTAATLEELFGPDPSVRITLVSDTASLLFTPMLSEVAGGSLEPTHISTPLRTALRRTEIVRSHVNEIQLGERRISVGPKGIDFDDVSRTLSYDHLVFALGSQSNHMGIENIGEKALSFKSLTDAIRIRNQVIESFERADRELDHRARRRLLTFVIAGGGFAGVELAGSLNDFARGIVADYPHILAQDLRIIVVHSRDRILPELSDPLASYAQKILAARGVTFELNSRVRDIQDGVVILDGGKEISSETLVWTAGNKPNTLLDPDAVSHDERGCVIVDEMLSVPGHPGVWALGDCAVVVDSRSGQRCPPTAQFAVRQAQTVARNVKAMIQGSALAPFHFDSLGSLCAVGYHTACAELMVPFFKHKVRFSGLLAWLMWRTVYLSKLPGRERKLRVIVDWIMETLFPRDIVQTIDLT